MTVVTGPTLGVIQDNLIQAFNTLDQANDQLEESLLGFADSETLHYEQYLQTQSDLADLVKAQATTQLRAESNAARLNILNGDTTVQQITALWLVNAATGADIRQLQRNSVIDFKNDPKTLNIRAVTATGSTPGNVGSVAFYLTGKLIRDEIQSGAPYYAFGDSGGVPYSYNLLEGDYVLFAVPYSLSAAKGQVGAGFELNIKVQDTTVVTDPGYKRQEAKIIAQTLFDGGTMNSIFKTEIYTDYAFAISSARSRFSGGYAARFEQRKDAIDASGQKVIRSEIKFNDQTKLTTKRKIGYSIYLPSAEFGNDTNSVNFYDIIFQEHGWDTRTPPRSMFTQGTNLFYKINWGATAGKATPDGSRSYDLGATPKDRWVDMVHDVNISYNNDGYANIYMSKIVGGVEKLVQVVKYVGPTAYNNSFMADYPKWGSYKRYFDIINGVVCWYDEIRYGAADCDIRDVMPDKDMPIVYLP